MSQYISIDPSAIEHATNQQARHQQFLDALEIVQRYCSAEHLFFSLSRDSGSRAVTQTSRIEGDMPKRRRIRQAVYENGMRSLFHERGVFTFEDYCNYAEAQPIFKNVSIQALESAIKRAVHGSKILERTELNGMPAYRVRPSFH